MARIKSHVVDFFRDLYSNLGLPRPKLDGLPFKTLSEEQRVWLERPFDENEIKSIIWSIEDDKSPGPDGFSMAFLKSCWEVLKAELMKTIDDFYIEGFLDTGSNAIFTSLIPKNEGAISIKDFRPPYSLVGSI